MSHGLVKKETERQNSCLYVTSFLVNPVENKCVFFYKQNIKILQNQSFMKDENWPIVYIYGAHRDSHFSF